jgi:hypothetical protein
MDRGSRDVTMNDTINQPLISRMLIGGIPRHLAVEEAEAGVRRACVIDGDVSQ